MSSVPNNKPATSFGNLYIGLDLGGTTLSSGLISEDGTVLLTKAERLGEDRSVKGIVAKLVQHTLWLCAEQKLDVQGITGIGLGVPGINDYDLGVVVGAAAFPDWKNVPLTELVSAQCGQVPTFLENDANAALGAEVWVGAARGKTNAVMVTLGTGVGGALLVNGNMVYGIGMAGEVGHTILYKNGRACGCGQRGCYERYVSASGIVVTATDNAEFRALHGPGAIECKTIFDLASEGKVPAVKVVAEWADDAAVGLLNLVRIVDPQLIVLSGGLTLAGQMVIDALDQAIAKHTWRFAHNQQPTFVMAQVGNDAGFIGAAAAAVSRTKQPL